MSVSLLQVNHMQGTITVTLVAVIFCPGTNIDSPRIKIILLT